MILNTSLPLFWQYQSFLQEDLSHLQQAEELAESFDFLENLWKQSKVQEKESNHY